MTLFVIRYAEIGLKGKNRGAFESLLQKNILKHLHAFPATIQRKRLRFLAEVDADPQKVLPILQRIPGIASVSPVTITELSVDALFEAAHQIVKRYVEQHPDQTIPFRVSAKRANKRFALNSNELQIQLGAALVKSFPCLKVQLENPTLNLTVDVTDQECLLYDQKYPGTKGMPVDPRNKVLSLISGGIDSPVASWMMMKRGCSPIYVYFHSFPFIGEQTKNKVKDLVKILSQTQLSSKLIIVSLTDIQKAIKAECPEKFRTLLYRRYMNYIVNEIAEQEGAKAIVTGDSLAQVASQTLDNLICTTENATLPVLRPLVGMDKEEIIEVARRIETFETSILDFPDCCTVFQPEHPATQAKLHHVQEAEAHLDTQNLVQQALESIETITFSVSQGSS